MNARGNYRKGPVSQPGSERYDMHRIDVDIPAQRRLRSNVTASRIDQNRRSCAPDAGDTPAGMGAGPTAGAALEKRLRMRSSSVSQTSR